MKKDKEDKTFKEKIFSILEDDYFDPYNGTDKIVNLVRKIMRDEINKLDNAMEEASKNKQYSLASNYGSLIYCLRWILDNKFDFKKGKYI